MRAGTRRTGFFQKLGAKLAGVLVGRRMFFNFIDTASAQWTLTDDPANDEVEVRVTALGGGGGSAHVIKENGTTLSQRAGLNFGNGLIASDDLANDESDVNVDFGTGATQAVAGNDARLSDQRTPTDNSVTNAKVSATAAIDESKLNLASDAAAGTASRRTLGTGATQAAAGNHTHDDRYERPFFIGAAGTPAVGDDKADFYVPVPFNCTLKRLKATSKTAVSALTTYQLRRSTDGGATFADYFGTVDIANGARLGSSDPADLDLTEGDVLNFSIDAGSGYTNPMLVAVAKHR